MRRNLKNAREIKGLTQAEVAKRAGISREYYVQLEAGVRDPSFRVAFRIADVLGADPRHLFADVLEASARQKSA